MTVTGIYLLALWVSSHILILFAVRNTRQFRAVLVLIAAVMTVVYLIKPYTYDLNKYSIFFVSGYIPTLPWHSNADHWELLRVTKDHRQNNIGSADNPFYLDSQDTTGRPFESGFEFGFNRLAKLGNRLLPEGAIVPRIGADIGDFKESGPPRSDAIIYLIIVLGLGALWLSVYSFNTSNDSERISNLSDPYIVVPIVLGSVFFILGSQNALRQFLGLSLVILAIPSMVLKRYFIGVIILFLSSLFHTWAPFFGLIAGYLILLGKVDTRSHCFNEVRPFFASRQEVFALITGISLVILIKVVLVLGLFNTDFPLVGELKPYVIMEVNFVALERLGPLVKGAMIIGLLLLSEAIMGKTTSSSGALHEMRPLRRRTMAFILPLIVFPEIFARVLMLYWAVEVLFLVWAINSDDLRVRLGGATVFVAYGFAPNAINVLIGPNWIYSL